MTQHFTRRQFFAAASAATTAAAAVGAMPKQQAHGAPKAQRPLVCVFSKHLQFLDYKELAKTCKELGLDGVDLTVRKGGHVLPENAATDLPRAAEAIRAEGLEVAMITTRLTSGSDPDAKPILEAASKLGIPYFRIGGQKYDKNADPLAQLAGFSAELRSLAALAEQCNMTAGYHNHSGYGNVGAPLWDLRHMFDAIGSSHMGSNFDVGHATVEGAYGVWETNARLMTPHVKMMAVKDFIWDKDKPQWVRLGNGVVKLEKMLAIMRDAAFTGPVSIHIEYKVASDDAMIEEIGESAKVLRSALEAAGYPA